MTDRDAVDAAKRIVFNVDAVANESDRIRNQSSWDYILARALLKERERVERWKELAARSVGPARNAFDGEMCPWGDDSGLWLNDYSRALAAEEEKG